MPSLAVVVQRAVSAHRCLLRLVLLVTFATGVPAVAGPESDAHKIQLETLRERINGLHSQMRSTSGERNELTRLLQESEQQIGRLARRLRVLDGRLDRHREQLAELEVDKAAQLRALAEQREALAQQVRAAYAMGRQERLRILLNQQDPATVSRVMVYYDYLNRARAQRMETIRRQMAAFAETEREIQREEAALNRLRDEQETELAALNRNQVQRQSVVTELTRELKDQGRQLDRLQRDETELKALIRGLESALADIPTEHPQQQRFGRLQGKLPWPASGRIVHRFGTPKLGSLRWDGVMISAPEGREVRAVHHGRVAFADWLRGFGLLLIVEHGDGYMTLYGHNQSLFKEVGDWVDVNEPVALVGTSGGRAQAGVYFGIRHKGRPVNPAKWCRRPNGRTVG